MVYHLWVCVSDNSFRNAPVHITGVWRGQEIGQTPGTHSSVEVMGERRGWERDGAQPPASPFFGLPGVFYSSKEMQVAVKESGSWSGAKRCRERVQKISSAILLREGWQRSPPLTGRNAVTRSAISAFHFGLV